MNWIKEASNLLTFIDTWADFDYFKAIDTIETIEDTEFLCNGTVPLGPFTSLDQFNDSGLQPLHYAIKCKNDLALQWILSHENVRVNAFTEFEKWNSAHCSIKYENRFALENVLELNVDLNALDNDQITPLAYIENESDFLDILDKCLALNKLNFKTQLSPSKKSYFHYWSRDSTISLLNYLIMRNPSDINLQDSDGTTALMLASESGQVEALKKLICNGAKFEIVDGKGRTALHRAASSGQSKACQILLFDPQMISLEMDGEYLTELDSINSSLAVEKAKSLDQLSVFDSEGLTPLMAAIFNGHTETVKVLTNLSDRDHLNLAHKSTGNTALHWAVFLNSPEIVKLLLKADVFPDPVNFLDKKPIQLAEPDTDIYNLLIDL